MKNVTEIFADFFEDYKEDTGKSALKYVVTCTDRPGDPEGSPHKLLGNAVDLTLRWRGDYAPIKEYNALIIYALDNWPYRMGLDNTPQPTIPGGKGNVHIHVDLGRTPIAKKTGMPYFFIEDNGVFQRQIIDPEDVTA